MYHFTVCRGFQGALDWTTMMPRADSFSNSWRINDPGLPSLKQREERLSFPFGSKSKGKLSPRSYPIQFERKYKMLVFSVCRGSFSISFSQCKGNGMLVFPVRMVQDGHHSSSVMRGSTCQHLWRPPRLCHWEHDQAWSRSRGWCLFRY